MARFRLPEFSAGLESAVRIPFVGVNAIYIADTVILSEARANQPRAESKDPAFGGSADDVPGSSADKGPSTRPPSLRSVGLARDDRTRDVGLAGERLADRQFPARPRPSHRSPNGGSRPFLISAFIRGGRKFPHRRRARRQSVAQLAHRALEHWVPLLRRNLRQRFQHKAAFVQSRMWNR